MQILTFDNDLPADIPTSSLVAIDTETMGLNHVRDRLCLVQLTFDAKTVYLVKFNPDADYHAPNLSRLLEDDSITKIFHYARFDVLALSYYLEVTVNNVFCTKIASYLARTYTSRHGLKDLVKEYLGVEISKQSQTSDWGAPSLTDEQKTYAATDVIYLHALRAKLIEQLNREDRLYLAEECFDFLNTRVDLDMLGMGDIDVFQHSLGK